MKTIVMKYDITKGSISGYILHSFDKKETAQAYIRHLAENPRNGIYAEKRTKNTFTCSKLSDTSGNKKYILFMINPTVKINTSPKEAVLLQRELIKEWKERTNK